LGCIYDTWTDLSTGEIVNTFSILTTEANPLMEKIHNQKKRMPLMLKVEDEAKWLDSSLSKESLQKLIKPFDENLMKAYSITRDANSSKVDRNYPEILEPVVYQELD
jgi:putative SOS response-associated peptidase YedK